jgi:poly-beta-1,6-N-acetyl-D-glucosamine synthase
MTAIGISLGALVLHAAVLFRWARGWRLAQAFKPSSQSRPTSLTVLIPARNEEHSILGVLDDLAAQSPSIPLSVVLVNDHSTDGTVAAAERHALSRDGRLKRVSNDGVGKKSALITGLQHVNTPWAVTLDADVRLDSGWLEAWHRCLSRVDDEVGGVAGPVVLLEREVDTTWVTRMQALDFAAQMGWSAGQLARGQAGSASGANLAVRPATYPDTRALGPSGDDTLVVQALHAAGHKVLWLADPQARVWTPGANSFREWVSQRLRWAGKTLHYPWEAKRTAAWMGTMAAIQWALIAMASLGMAGVSWAWAAGWWAGVTALNVVYARPVARWFGVKARVVDWGMLGLTQPFQVPVLLLTKAGLLRPLGIASQPTWKGRTCTP